jgi:hypothetical protein
VVLSFGSSNLVTGRGAITLGFGAPLGEDPVDLDDFATTIGAQMTLAFPSIFDSQVTFDTIYVANDQESVFRSVSVAGTQDFADPPPNVAVLVQKSTSAKGRRGRGRTFLYGVTGEGDVDTAGNLASGRRNAIQSGWDFFIDGILDGYAAQDLREVILQSTTPTGPGAPVNPTPPLDPPPIVTSRTVASKVATQRRRLRR